MSDLIYRSHALNAINMSLTINSAWMSVAELPSAQPHGKWILETYQIRCSHCNKLFSDYLFTSNYCPNCGADMRGESDE